VDDTIHFLTRFRRELAVDGDVDAAIARSFVGVGTALIMTTVVLVAGFATVISSELPGNRTFGLMACSTIGAALIGDLIILPAILSRFVPRNAALQEALHLREVVEVEPPAESLPERAC
jgi:predicted RND superfamily exporter protein